MQKKRINLPQKIEEFIINFIYNVIKSLNYY